MRGGASPRRAGDRAPQAQGAAHAEALGRQKSWVWGRTRVKARVAGAEMGDLLPGAGKCPETGKGIEMDLATFCHYLETLIPFGPTQHGEERRQKSSWSQGALHSSPPLSIGDTCQEPQWTPETVVSTESSYTIFLM